ncbi:hypothetical protein [Methanolapillus millepedarum]|uniref:Uncharacterized protein n=1 Tax=Methanolapillus millepedarum TaxID=3028296 RepID=A0AA97A4J7_9EURY|nr:hypothetical protein MsAc7_14630 [Methanosarcinaceae archaeon Ac7]
MFFYNPNSKNNNRLFICFLLIFTILFSVPYLFDFTDRDFAVACWAILIMIFLPFSGPIYGFLSKMKWRAVFLGFLFPFFWGASNLISDLYLYRLVLDSGYIITIISNHFPFVLMGVSSGIAGYFSATTEEDNFKKGISYLLVIIFSALSLYLFYNPPYNLITSVFYP